MIIDASSGDFELHCFLSRECIGEALGCQQGTFTPMISDSQWNFLFSHGVGRQVIKKSVRDNHIYHSYSFLLDIWNISPENIFIQWSELINEGKVQAGGYYTNGKMIVSTQQFHDKLFPECYIVQHIVPTKKIYTEYFFHTSFWLLISYLVSGSI